MAGHLGNRLQPLKDRLTPEQLKKRTAGIQARSYWRQNFAAALNQTRMGTALAIERGNVQTRLNRYFVYAMVVSYFVMLAVVGRVFGWW